jgi:nucleoside-diphosphate-sugar epimerase
MKKVLVLGGGGFIGGHLAKRLYEAGHFVRVVDIKEHEYFRKEDYCSEFYNYDLTKPLSCGRAFYLADNQSFDEVYQLAAEMGGAGYIFTGKNDASIMHNSALINLNVLENAVKMDVKKIFYSSSACIYPAHNQVDPNNPNCEESSAYPANPDSEYGWEKLFSERLYLAYSRNNGLDVRIARFHNVFGPYGIYKGGKEKAPSAICRKVAEAKDMGEIEIWGDGEQTRSFLYIDECVEGILRLMDSNFQGPVNIGSEEMVTINELAHKAISTSGKKLTIKHIDGPTGVRGRNSDNKLLKEKLGWVPSAQLMNGISETYKWIEKQIQ